MTLIEAAGLLWIALWIVVAWRLHEYDQVLTEMLEELEAKVFEEVDE